MLPKKKAYSLELKSAYQRVHMNVCIWMCWPHLIERICILKFQWTCTFGVQISTSKCYEHNNRHTLRCTCQSQRIRKFFTEIPISLHICCEIPMNMHIWNSSHWKHTEIPMTMPIWNWSVHISVRIIHCARWHAHVNLKRIRTIQFVNSFQWK